MDYIIDVYELSPENRAKLLKAMFLRERGDIPNSIRAVNRMGCSAIYVTDGDSVRRLQTQNGNPSTYNAFAKRLWESSKIDGLLLNL